MEIILIYSLK